MHKQLEYNQKGISIDFLKAFRTFEEATNQKALTAQYLCQRLPALLSVEKECTKILDVGCGDGALSIPLYNFLSVIYGECLIVDLLEPSEEMTDSFKKRYETQKGKRFKIGNIFNEKWETFEKKENYNFILCSHVMYNIFENTHLTRELKLGYLRKFKQFLKTNGLICIIYHASEGNEAHFVRKEFYKKFNFPNIISSGKDLETALGVLGYRYTRENIYALLGIDWCLIRPSGITSLKGERLLDFMLGYPYKDIAPAIKKEIDVLLGKLMHPLQDMPLCLSSFLHNQNNCLIIKSDVFMVKNNL